MGAVMVDIVTLLGAVERITQRSRRARTNRTDYLIHSAPGRGDWQHVVLKDDESLSLGEQLFKTPRRARRCSP
jgi:hypothetical protein